MSISFEIIRERIDRIASRIIDIGGEVQEIVIQDPATENQIELVEHHLGIALPNSFKQVLLNFF
ncbi:hypothetical protein D3C74_180950 [compost metagenome]